MRAGQRPVLARNDPLNIFGSQRQQTLLIAAAHCCKKIFHNLDVLLNAHRTLHFFSIGSRGVGNSAETDAKLLLHYGRLVVATKRDDLSTLEVINIAARDIYCLARGS
jgi:predicted AAA+ superfamily ATPase